MKHLYLVKKEVRADSVEEAIRVRKGKIYSVEIAEDRYQPEALTKKTGFVPKK